MKRLFIHDIMSSWTQWFENSLLEGEGYTNTSGQLYYTKDETLPNYITFSSPSKQWVYNTSITGAQVPSGVYVNGDFIPRGGSGLKIDFQEGRVLFPSGSGDSSWTVSGNYAVKEFNIYRTTKSDEELVFNRRFMFNPEFSQVATGVGTDTIIAPAIFLKLVHFTNTPFEIGGLNESTIRTRAIILSDTDYNIDAIGNIFSDKKYNNFVIFPKTPLNEFGDVKGGNYNYNDLMTGYFSPSTIPYIADVSYSKLLAVGIRDIDPDLKVGFLDFTIKHARTTP